MRKHTIQIRDYNGKRFSFPAVTPEILGTVTRRIYSIACGNFAPLYCRFNRKTYLVHSDAGDVSDPFRANETYLETLFIDISKPCQFSI